MRPDEINPKKLDKASEQAKGQDSGLNLVDLSRETTAGRSGDKALVDALKDPKALDAGYQKFSKDLENADPTKLQQMQADNAKQRQALEKYMQDLQAKLEQQRSLMNL